METLAYLHLALAYEETRDAVSPDLGEMLESLNPTKETLLGEKLKFVSKLNWRSLCSAIAIVSMVLPASAIQKQDKGSEVTDLQNKLTAAEYYDGPVTGYYGKLTEAAVKQFQSAKGLAVDGVAGEDTLEALQKHIDAISKRVVVVGVAKRGLRLGDRGEEVKDIQQRLKAAGFDPGPIDVKFGAKTAQAVRQFQADRGLDVDGIVGKETWFALGYLGSSNSPYVVAVTPWTGDTINQVMRHAPDAYLDESKFASYIHAGAFQNQPNAESQAQKLRSLGLDARVVYLR